MAAAKSRPCAAGKARASLASGFAGPTTSRAAAAGAGSGCSSGKEPQVLLPVQRCASLVAGGPHSNVHANQRIGSGNSTAWMPALQDVGGGPLEGTSYDLSFLPFGIAPFSRAGGGSGGEELPFEEAAAAASKEEASGGNATLAAGGVDLGCIDGAEAGVTVACASPTKARPLIAHQSAAADAAAALEAGAACCGSTAAHMQCCSPPRIGDSRAAD
ncbi:uncharacterized protein LOC34622939 [Cyclospora cayetanensis]|uniref:Uncharacterized protein LOC34622939 n=1 Tax=Cyclospora cayetanensis TaxID=88456 RepID=A0A6P6RZQ3_9EIME|nr:uncharacterized protein LOC34622939 [Cyclospora cayetanensis]